MSGEELHEAILQLLDEQPVTAAAIASKIGSTPHAVGNALGVLGRARLASKAPSSYLLPTMWVARSRS